MTNIAPDYMTSTIYTTLGIKKNDTLLIAPFFVRYFNADEILALTNGCGPESWKHEITDFITRFILGNVEESCRIHDLCYSFGNTDDDRKVADKIFLANMLTQIAGSYAPRWIRKLRVAKAFLVYKIVRSYGEDAFVAAARPQHFLYTKIFTTADIRYWHYRTVNQILNSVTRLQF